jgi:hypothetical protein
VHRLRMAELSFAKLLDCHGWDGIITSKRMGLGGPVKVIC